MKKKLLVEKYSFSTLISSILGRYESVCVLDSNEFYPNLSLKKSFFHRIAENFFKQKINFYPNYSDNFSHYSELMWEANQEGLDYCQKSLESRVLASSLGKFIQSNTHDSKTIICLKKLQSEEMALKFYLAKLRGCYDINLKDCNEFQLHEGSSIGTFWNLLTSRLILLGLLLFRPFLVRLILRNRFTLATPKKQTFNYGVHLTYGFKDIENKAVINDAKVFEELNSENKHILFVQSIWKLNNEDFENLNKLPKNYTFDIANEFKNKIPLLFFLRVFLKSYFSGLLLLPQLLLPKWKVNISTYKHALKSVSEYLNYSLFCQYYDVKKFISRDDYASTHVTRTIVQNQYGNQNLGIMHSGFTYPRFVPQGAFTYFDTYFVQGDSFKELWAPFWNDNKNFCSVGLTREHLVQQELEDRKTRDKFDSLFKDKITILMLISAHDNVLSPFHLLKQKHEGLSKLFDLNPNIHLILKPRRLNAIESFFEYCPELVPYRDENITIITDEFTTQELIANVEIMVSEDSSSSLLESLPNKELFAFYFMIRYGIFEPQKDFTVYNSKELISLVSIYLNNSEAKDRILEKKNALSTKYTTLPFGKTWGRIAAELER